MICKENEPPRRQDARKIQMNGKPRGSKRRVMIALVLNGYGSAYYFILGFLAPWRLI
jgi:hypothetical protein